MARTITPIAIDVKPQAAGFNDVVYRVKYYYGDENHSVFNQTDLLNPEKDGQFIPVSQVTSEIAAQWVLDQLGSKEVLDKIIDQKIAAEANVPYGIDLLGDPIEEPAE